MHILYTCILKEISTSGVLLRGTGTREPHLTAVFQGRTELGRSKGDLKLKALKDLHFDGFFFILFHSFS